MVVLSRTANTDPITVPKNNKPILSSDIPTIDLARPDAKLLVLKACEEFGFLKIVNHGIPMAVMDCMEEEAVRFFSLSQADKDKAGPSNPFGYGNKKIGPNGDVGWIEYLLLKTDEKSISQRCSAISAADPDRFWSARNLSPPPSTLSINIYICLCE